MTTKPIEPQRVSRHPYSTSGLCLRILLHGAMLTSITVVITGGQPVGALSAEGREPVSDSVYLSDGEPTDGTAVSSGSAGGTVLAAITSPGTPGSGSAGGPPAGWYLYHHWTDPSWPGPEQAAGERLDADDGQPHASASRTASTPGREPSVTPMTDPPPTNGWTQTPGYPDDPTPGTPTGAPTKTGPAPDPTVPAPDPTGPDKQPDPPTTPPGTPAISEPPGSPSSPEQDGDGGPQPSTPQPGGPQPSTPQADVPQADVPQASAPPAAVPAEPPAGDPLPRDPVAAGPDDTDLSLGGTVDEPMSTPQPTKTAGAQPLQAAPTRVTPVSNEYQQTLVYSGLTGLVLAAIGLGMVGLRRRRW